MEDQLKNISNAFSLVLDSLIDGEQYELLPPKGPVDLPLPSVSDQELDAIDQDIYGQDEREEIGGISDVNGIKLVESHEIKKIVLPSEEQLNGLNIIGISGTNNRILTTSFHLILAQSSIVNFKYTKGFEKPYFYTKSRSASAILVLDNNIFENTYSVHTYNDLVGESNKFPILDHLTKNQAKPFRFKYDHEKSKKAPNSQSLGLAVKFQHALELASIIDTEIDSDGTIICIKDGALFSNSSEQSDVKNGLRKLLAWSGKKKMFISISSKVSESRVIIKTLSSQPHLIQDYFPNQGINEGTIAAFGTDVLLLKKILKPGYRTPLIEYIEKTREGIIKEPGLEGLKPLTCYYHKRSKPYNFVRLEIPKFMWEENQALAEFAILIAIWQYELGGDKPLVIKAASERCALDHDKWVIEQQMKAAFDKKNLELVEF
ncbi:MAG: hypothetical protein J0I32_15865 [Sphingobacteriales bacterium]|nr:hypothetical protein [Sphingobacteriales bacterium]OJW01778.1 MAG: hypothetical protein BGO52_15010 [Sphingobacteriales bacterium 44-61]